MQAHIIPYTLTSLGSWTRAIFLKTALSIGIGLAHICLFYSLIHCSSFVLLLHLLLFSSLHFASISPLGFALISASFLLSLVLLLVCSFFHYASLLLLLILLVVYSLSPYSSFGLILISTYVLLSPLSLFRFDPHLCLCSSLPSISLLVYFPLPLGFALRFCFFSTIVVDDIYVRRKKRGYT